MTRTILSIIILVLTCWTILSHLPYNINIFIPKLIIASHIVLFISYILKQEDKNVEDVSNKIHKRINVDKKEYSIINSINIGDKKVIEYKSNRSDKTYFIEEKEFYDKFAEIK